MAIVRHGFPEVDEFPTGLRLFQDTLNRMLSDQPAARPWMPPVDIFETENDVVLKADVPEMSLENIDIQLENGTLTIKGERKFNGPTNGNGQSKGNGFHRVERSYGTFARYFSLPDTVDAENVHAAYDKGVLTITLPKKEVAKPRTIKVQVSNN